MKGEPTEEESNYTMFAKFQHHHHYQQYHHLNQEHQIQLEEGEEESRSSSIGVAAAAAEGTIPKKSKTKPGGGGDGATIEVVQRPRGRPPGSKNKPKPQVLFVSTPRDTDYCSLMQPLILEVPCGVDVVESIARYARRQNIWVCVLNGSGTVSNVSVRQPSINPLGASVVTFHGSFDILSISATFLPPSSSLQSSLATNYKSHFAITLAGPQGQIFGGSVVGTLIAATTVFIVTASFTTPSYHRLPIEDDELVLPSSVVLSDKSAHHHPQASTTTASEESHPPTTESRGMSNIHNYHLPASGVIWAPIAKQPLSPPPQQPPRF
ncbi:protein of unknown function DUF296 [Macleaya cordata]|uniref:AT-hook motif nuclear-localized protein n=1 Tax=Macleaya cordata TaxID=56857 RepID=A0A200PNL0_MACCD|nr:protein of unknown function DUF296 [Macleaya cordata]